MCWTLRAQWNGAFDFLKLYNSRFYAPGQEYVQNSQMKNRANRTFKGMPDALSKTIPIWCAVLNHAIFQTELDVQTPVGVISDSEHQQITEKLDDLSSRFLVSAS